MSQSARRAKVEDEDAIQRRELASALMSEITSRLEDLAARSVSLHRSSRPALALRAEIDAVRALIDAQIVLATPSKRA